VSHAAIWRIDCFLSFFCAEDDERKKASLFLFSLLAKERRETLFCFFVLFLFAEIRGRTQTRPCKTRALD